MKRYVVLLAVLLLSAAATVNADVMVFDRGLPTANLNNDAGANRSNVSWAFPTPWYGLDMAVGDDFSFGTTGSTYDITDLRVWIVGTGSQPLSTKWSDLTLYGGDTTNATVQSTVSTSGSDPNVQITQTTYGDGENYQGSSGSFIDIWQVDFLLNWVVSGNTTHTFFVGGTPAGTNGYSPSLHASNAALSGSTQQGADNLFWNLGWDPTTDSVYPGWMWQSDSNAPNVWDKSSDINVQVFAATPEPSAWVLMGTLLLSLGFLVRRRYQ